MYEQETQRATHLMVLLCCTIFTIVLTAESILLKWETGAVILLLLGLAVSWGIYITGKIPESFSLWLYFTLTMVAFFFYGIHETSIYDLAPVMIVVITIYSATEIYSIIRLCVVTYFLTMCYDFVFVMGGSFEFTSLSITRILLHLALVYMAGRLAKLGIQRRRKERKETDIRIAELEEANRRTEDFLTNVSHELRTPINAVTGITAVMLKNEEDILKKKDILSVQMAGHRLFSQIEDILDYTEIDTGRIKVSEDTYMVTSLINDIISGNHQPARENAPELIFDVDADIPSVLLGDGRKIKKIIKHLIDNAVKFTKRGGVYVRVYALKKPYGINLCIRVSDTGVGIAEAELGKIKERFFQSNGGRNRKAGGLGLGLSIVYGMVAAMEGFIQIESTEGTGTTVSVSIPQKVLDDAPGMVVENRGSLCLACFLNLEKYEVPEVRKYYNEMISHMVRGLDISLHRVATINELERLTSMHQLTHLFIGREEFEENESYFEGLDKSIEVVLVADDSFELSQNSRLKLIRKPFYCLPVINILNAGAAEDAELLKEKYMICPGVRVLVVDDEPMNLMVAEGIFKDYQMQVKTAHSGMEAINLCEKEDFDLIFLDHMMPEMDGVETLKRLRRLHTDAGKVLTVIAFTANAVSGAREMFLQEGFDEFVSKPIEELELERVLRKVLPKVSIEFVDEAYVKNKKAVHRAEQNPGENESSDKQLSEKKPGDDKIRRLERAEINTKSGIQYCRGDVDFYEELLTKFARDEERKAAETTGFLQKGDIENYRILVHALKSTAKMIGADLLSDMARKAEEAAKNHDEAYIKAHHEELLTKYHDTVQCIFDALDIGDDVSVQPAGENCTEISGDKLIQRLAELKESLDTFEAEKADALISEMSGSIINGTLVAELLRDVKQDVEEFEFSAAAEKIDVLIKGVEGGGEA